MRSPGFTLLVASVILTWFLVLGARASELGTSAPTLTFSAHSILPKLISPLSSAVPTSKFWSQLILGNGRDIITPLPYFAQSSARGLGIAYPDVKSTAESVTAHPATMEVIVGALEDLEPNHIVTAHDELSVTLRFTSLNANGSPSYIAFPLVRGSPYITALYTQLTPAIRTTSKIASIRGLSQDGTSASSRFAIVLSTGHVWTVYIAQPASVKLSDEHTIVFLSSYSGSVRIAAVPSPEAEVLLDAHAGTYPIGCSIRHDVSNSTATISFQFILEGDGLSELLMLALPHHIEALGGTQVVIPGAFQVLKGPMSGLIGSRWELTVKLPELQWLSPVSSLPVDLLDALRASLAADTTDLKIDAADPYNFGSAVARVAQLALIAEELKDVAVATMCRDIIKAKLKAFAINDSHSNALVYDDTWGGVVARNALWAPEIDAGNGWYSDHYAQYGPILFAAAVVQKQEPGAFAASAVADLLLLLARDVANPNATDDVWFPATRHKDWYEWHSWSDGLLTNGDVGRTISSVSASTAAYHSLALFASANGLPATVDLARVLTAMELCAARKYWFPPRTDIYAATFSNANEIVATVSALAITSASTPIAALVQHILPLSPVTDLLLEAARVADMARVMAASVATLPPYAEVYRSFYLLAGALVDPSSAFNALASLSQYHSSMSRTQALYWTAAHSAPFAKTGPLPVPTSLSTLNKFNLRVRFTTPKTLSVANRTKFDTGEAFTKVRGYGWVGSLPTLAARTTPITFGRNFDSVAIFGTDSEWYAELPAAGDYTLRLALAPAVEGGKCGGLTLIDGDDQEIIIGSCAAPLVFSTHTATLSSPILRLASDNNAALALVEIFNARGTLLQLKYNTTTQPSRLTEDLLSKVSGVAKERIHVRYQDEASASVLVNDPQLSASLASANAVAAVFENVPRSAWVENGLYVRSVTVNPQESTTSPSASTRSLLLSPTAMAFVVLGGFLFGSAVVLGILYAKYRQQKAIAQLPIVTASELMLGSAPNSVPDLLRGTSSSNAVNFNPHARPGGVHHTDL